jgi:biotin carboxyl carrier protein
MVQLMPVSDSFSVSTDDLKRLSKLVADNNLSELRYESEGGVRITMRTASYQPSVSLMTAGVAPVVEATAETETVINEEIATSTEIVAATQAVKSPIMGVFYHRFD